MSRNIVGVVATTLALAAPCVAQTFDESMTAATAEYRARAERAADEFNRARAIVEKEKAPLLRQMRAAEDRIIALESETTRLETLRANAAEDRRKKLIELDGIRKVASFAETLAHDGLKAAGDALAPGEEQFVGGQIESLIGKLENTASPPNAGDALAAAEFLLSHTEESLGGYRAKGKALITDTGEVLPGAFAFAGPESFFLPDGGQPGTIRPRQGSNYPASYALPGWNAANAAAFFSGKAGTFVADASGGKALRLKESKGSLWQHINKGGVMAFAIIGVGLIAVLMIIQKVRDLSGMGMDSPSSVEGFLDEVARGAAGDAAKRVDGFKRTVRQLFAAGLRYIDSPKVILEERLQSVLLAQRIHYERRLPLLAVIATAAPLMGLLGTVIGMVKTFALITVFGTGNAAKLASGISEVLVATELGLMVAIPTLVAHGFLAQRIQRNLSRLERYALEFCTAVETAKSSQDAADSGGSRPA